MNKIQVLSAILLVFAASLPAQSSFKTDYFKADGDSLGITFIGHGTLMLSYGGKVIHIDPVGRSADYTTLPKADLVLVTHEHGDHLDPDAIAKISKEGIQIILPEESARQLGRGTVLKNGESKSIVGFGIEAVPAYNLVHKRDNGQPYHPKGRGNGYVITVGKLRVYVAGDTENTPEMKALKNIDIAFLPMNLPYTMTPAMVVDAAKAFRPKILYPYHYGDTNVEELIALMKGEKGIEVRIRDMK
jgi:L-ascorbate metabolism protein UlaG (beta-lactamase superfamily)